ncbi:mitochondrial amidoxime reducing component 2-like [Panicum miliaceum]|uniref:Mitochondrial amidoxime reducing component 2-like n=1 Tax=Panicum miliaceum TaxID=4540 RepID=A0A3L6QRM5_PANMI|nr:mitochondrial amidoxime reducing component 2-like [Panicum miliaceum]
MAMEKAASFLSSLVGGGGSPEPAATVRSITIYPLKSCRGIFVPQATVTSTGFRWDRQWMVVNDKGRAVTQRVEPSLALVGADMPPEAFAAEDWQPAPDSHSHMVIRAPGMDPLKIPLAAEHATVDGVAVWGWSGSAYDQGAEAAEWFSAYLGKPSRLVRFKEVSETRPTDPDYAQGYKVMFVDAFPILIASQVPNVDQENATPGVEPNETLRTFRSGEVYFGQNLVCKESLSANGKGRIIKVGDPVYVLQSFSSRDEAPA